MTLLRWCVCGCVSGFQKPLTFEVSVVAAGPPAGSVPYPVQTLVQLHDDAKLVPGPSQLLLRQQRPIISPAADPCSAFSLHCHLLCMSRWNRIPAEAPGPAARPAEMRCPWRRLATCRGTEHAHIELF